MGLNCLKATESLWGGSLLFTTKFSEIPEYNLRNIFLKNHIYTRCGGETIPRPFSKKLKLNISLDRNSTYFAFIVCQVEDYRNWLKLSCRTLAFNLSHIQLFSNTKRGLCQAVFSTWTKNQDKNINILGTKRAFNMK